MSPPPPPRLVPLRDFSDQLSPMLVKELRHGLRTRAFTLALLLFHLTLLLLMVTLLNGADPEDVNGLFWTICGFSLLAALPLRAFSALTQEIQGGTLDMLRLTGLSSTRIVWGKWASYYSQSLLLASSLLPYLIARYQFGGVEIVPELMALTIILLASALSTAAILAFSSQKRPLTRLFLACGTALGLIPCAIVIAILVAEKGGGEVMDTWLGLALWEQISLTLGTVTVVAYLVFLLVNLAATRIATESELQNSRKRAIMLLFTLLVTLVSLLLVGLHPDEDVGFIGFITLVGLTLIAGLDLTTEPIPQHLPHTNTATQWLRRCFFRSGWVHALPFYLLLSSLTLSILAGITVRSGHVNLDDDEWLYLLLTLMIHLPPMCLPCIRDNRLANWLLIQCSFLAAGMLIHIAMEVTDSQELGFLSVISPISTLFVSPGIWQHEDDILFTSLAFTGAWFLLALVSSRREQHRLRHSQG